MKLVFVQRECEYRFAKSPGAAMLMPHLSLTQSNRPTQSHYWLLLKWELLQLLKGDEELRSMLRKHRQWTGRYKYINAFTLQKKLVFKLHQ